MPPNFGPAGRLSLSRNCGPHLEGDNVPNTMLSRIRERRTAPAAPAAGRECRVTRIAGGLTPGRDRAAGDLLNLGPDQRRGEAHRASLSSVSESAFDPHRTLQSDSTAPQASVGNVPACRLEQWRAPQARACEDPERHGALPHEAGPDRGGVWRALGQRVIRRSTKTAASGSRT